jgi:hypothetical protein
MFVPSSPNFTFTLAVGRLSCQGGFYVLFPTVYAETRTERFGDGLS